MTSSGGTNRTQGKESLSRRYACAEGLRVRPCIARRFCFSATEMGTPTIAAPPAPPRHAGRHSRAARAGLVLAVIAVTATVGVGTWVLGSGADAAPRTEEPISVLSEVTQSEPPLSIAPPPTNEKKAKASAKKTAAAGSQR